MKKSQAKRTNKHVSSLCVCVCVYTKNKWYDRYLLLLELYKGKQSREIWELYKKRQDITQRRYKGSKSSSTSIRISSSTTKHSQPRTTKLTDQGLPGWRRAVKDKWGAKTPPTFTGGPCRVTLLYIHLNPRETSDRISESA